MNKIEQKIRDSNYSIQDICDNLGISRTAVYKWFGGESIPTINNLKLLSQILKCSIEELL